MTKRQNKAASTPATEAKEVGDRVKAGVRHSSGSGTKGTWTLDKAVRDEILSRVKTARESGAKARHDAAIATALVFEHKAIGVGRMYPTQGAYAAALGVSPGTVTGLKRLAVAIRVGITPDHPAWGAVSSKAGTAAVGAVADSKRPTIAAFTKAAKAEQTKADATAKAKALKAKAPRKDAASKAADTSAPATPSEGYDAVKAALEVLRVNREGLTASQTRATRSSLATLLAEYGATPAEVTEAEAV
jgi:hypothetical protein